MGKPGKNAYTLAYNALGKEVNVTDDNGLWRLHGVTRLSHSPHGPFQYLSHIKFRRHGDDLSGAYYRNIKYIDITEEGLLSAIRQAVGYIPSPQVIEAFLPYIRRLIAAWAEEDNYYKDQDKEQADLILQDLITRAAERVTRGEETSLSQTGSKWGRPAFDLYLTREEQAAAREAQKAINGSAHEVPDRVPLREHLADFKKSLATVCDAKGAQIRNAKALNRRRRLLDLLETAVELRRLVSLALAADKDTYGGGLLYELPHRLFGYTRDEKAYDDLRDKLSDMLRPYELELAEVNELVAAGTEYLAGGGMLPVAVPSFSRQEGEFAYGDRIIAGDRTDKVKKVGMHYIYGEKGGHWERASVKHWSEGRR
ncbi:MAG: hypothetical protein P4N41_12065 [Negativicutes bacterium]|nr:hypothetical protein [Negativicutes bacterium]